MKIEHDLKKYIKLHVYKTYKIIYTIYMYVIIHVCIIHMYVAVVEQFVVTPDTYIYGYHISLYG